MWSQNKCGGDSEVLSANERRISSLTATGDKGGKGGVNQNRHEFRLTDGEVKAYTV